MPESESLEVAEVAVAAAAVVAVASAATAVEDDLGLQPHAALVWPMAKAASARRNV